MMKFMPVILQLSVEQNEKNILISCVISSEDLNYI